MADHLVTEEAVEALARARWDARRQAIIDSGTAAGPGRAWDEIEPRSGRDVRATEWNKARCNLEEVAAILAPAIAAKAVEEKERQIERLTVAYEKLEMQRREERDALLERVERGQKAEAERDQAIQNRDSDLEHLGLVRCKSCDNGVISGTDSERDPEGNLVPVPVQERCPDCDGTGWRNQRADQAKQKERERLEKAITKPIHDLATHIGRGRVFAGNDEPKLARRELDCAAEALKLLRARVWWDR